MNVATENRFCMKFGGTQRYCFYSLLRERISSECNNGDCDVLSTEGVDGFISVHDWHVQVHKHKGKVRLIQISSHVAAVLENVDCLVPVSSKLEFNAKESEHFANDLSIDNIIIHNKYFAAVWRETTCCG